MDFLLGLKFTHFWGLVSKTPEIARFLDEFLQNVRKHNDIFKMQFLTQYETPVDSPQQRDASVHEEIRKTMNKMLALVLQVFHRLSLSIEGDEEYLSLGFYSKIVYDNWVFDMAKLIDIAAVFGKSNHEPVAKIIQNVFDNEKKFVQDFKEAFDTLMSLMRSKFSQYQKVQSMFKGEYIEELSVKD